MPRDNCICKTNHNPYKRINVTNRNNNSCTNTLSTRCSLSQKVKENVLRSCKLLCSPTFEQPTINTVTLKYSEKIRLNNSRSISQMGFKQADLQRKTDRTRRRSKTLRILQFICPKNHHIKKNFIPKSAEDKEVEELQVLQLKRNVVELYMCGHTEVSLVCASLLSKVIINIRIKAAMQTCFDEFIAEDNNRTVVASRL